MLLLLHPAVNRGGCWNKSGTFMACGVWLFSAHHCGGRFKRRPHRVFATCNRKTDYANFNQLQRYVLIIFMMSVITTSNTVHQGSRSAQMLLLLHSPYDCLMLHSILCYTNESVSRWRTSQVIRDTFLDILALQRLPLAKKPLSVTHSGVTD